MSFVSNFSNQMNMTEEQLDTLKDNYANLIVDGMDMRTLCQFAYDCIMENLSKYESDELKEEIVDLYGEETWEDLSA
jgi:hypothetical protein